MKYKIDKARPRRTAVLTVAAAGILMSVGTGAAWAQQPTTDTRPHAAAEQPIVLLEQDWLDSSLGDFAVWEAMYRCPPDQVMIGVRAPKADAFQGTSAVRCAIPVIGEHPTANAALIGQRTTSKWHDPVYEEWFGSECGSADDNTGIPLLASVHENGNAPRVQFRCAELVADSKQDHGFPGGQLTVAATKTERQPTITTDKGGFEFECPENMAISGRSQHHDLKRDAAVAYPAQVQFTCAAWKVSAK